MVDSSSQTYGCVSCPGPPDPDEDAEGDGPEGHGKQLVPTNHGRASGRCDGRRSSARRSYGARASFRTASNAQRGRRLVDASAPDRILPGLACPPPKRTTFRKRVSQPAPSQCAAAVRPERPAVDVTTRTAVWTLTALMAFAAIVIYRKGLGTTFFFDEWEFVMDRQPWRWDILLTPYNGHLSLLPVLVYKVLFATVGLGSYWVYRVVLIGFHLLCVGLVVAYARRRVGNALALCAAALVLFLGTSWHDLLVPFQIGFLGSVAGGVAMFIALDRRTFAGDVAAAAALAVSLSSSSIGIAFALAAFVEVLWLPGRWRRVWLAAVPFALYVAWYVDYRNSPQSIRAAVGPLEPALRANLPELGSYVASAAAAAFGALVGLGSDWGEVLLIGAVALVLVRLGTRGATSPRLVALLIAALVYWGLLGAFRAQLVAPSESRYIYGGAVLILLVVVEVAAGRRVGIEGIVLVSCLVAFSAVGNYAVLRSGSLSLQDSATHVRAELGGLEIAGRSGDPNYVPDQARTQGVRAGPYLAVVRAHGSPADSAAQIARQAEPVRLEADAVLEHALGISVHATSAARRTSQPVQLVSVGGGNVGRRGGCLVLRPIGAGAFVELALPPDGVIVIPTGHGQVAYSLRHFSAGYGPQPIGTFAGTSSIQVGRARTPLTWYLRLQTAQPLTACAAAGAGT
jgi:hypothetical protein